MRSVYRARLSLHSAARDNQRGCGRGAVLTVVRVAETGSTNADLLAMAARGEAQEGDWLIAERQTAGRGREGRQWVSPAGNFYGTTLVAIRDDDPPAPTLALVAGIALANTIGAPAYLKWPNDLMIGAEKAAGILLERQGKFVAIGIGINVVQAPAVPGRAVTCLAAHQLAFDEMSLFADIADAVALWRTQPLKSVADHWLDLAHPLDTPLRAADIDGRFAGLTDHGALRLALPDGAIRVIHAGDVFLI